MADKTLNYYDQTTQTWKSPYATETELTQLAQTVSNISASVDDFNDDLNLKFDKTGGVIQGDISANQVAVLSGSKQLEMRYDETLDEGQIIALEVGTQHLPITFVANSLKYRPSLFVPNTNAYDILTTENIMYGNQNPETNVTATVGTLYIDKFLGKMYLKTSGVGNVGWVEK